MRRPLLGIAFLLGPALMLALGSLPACTLDPSETADAGADVYIPPQGCDAVGEACNTCQACGTTQSACASFFQGCQGDDGCLQLASCVDACDAEPPTTISECVIECCNQAISETAVQNYNFVANCVYNTACPQSCNLQKTFNFCPSGI